MTDNRTHLFKIQDGRYTNEINPEAAWVAMHIEECDGNNGRSVSMETGDVEFGECTCGHSSVRVDWTLADIQDLFRLKGDVECVRIICNIPGREAWVDRELMT